jgi:hypothetical protein
MSRRSCSTSSAVRQTTSYNFAELKRNSGLDQGQLEPQAQLLVDASAAKRLARATNKAKKPKAAAKKPAR